MRKTVLALFVIAVSLCGSSFAQQLQWKIIKEVHITSGTATIPLTTLFTPELKGLYRLSVYVSAPSSSQTGDWTLDVTWFDEPTGLGQDLLVPIVSSGFGQVNGTSETLFTPKPGTPVQFDIRESEPPPTGSYNFAFTIEKLTN